MSLAQAIPIELPQPAPRGAEWLDLATASQRSGISERQLRRECRESLCAKGLASKMPSAAGRDAWLIRSDAMPSLATVKPVEAIPCDLRSLTDKQRRELQHRKGILDRWEECLARAVRAGKSQQSATDEFCRMLAADNSPAISAPTLHRWRAAYRANGISGLLDGRWQRDEEGDGERPFLSAVREYFLTPKRLSKRMCYELAINKAKESDFPIVSYRVCCRYLSSLPRAVVIKRREGDDAYIAKCEPSIQRDYSTLVSNEQFVGDHHRFDVVVDAGGKLVRPWLTAWMDMRSRYIVGWGIAAHDPNQNSILSALRAAIFDCGLPSMLYIDNGKDYSARVFHGQTKEQRRARVELDESRVSGILNLLGIKARFCWAYHGQSKPIERWFGTVEDRFGRTWPTYCGNSPANRPEDHQEILKRGEAPKLADFIEAFRGWLESDYHAKAHGGDSMEDRSPRAVYDSSWGQTSKRTSSAEILDLLLAKQSNPTRVGKNGVKYMGLFYGQNCPELFPLLGHDVILRVDERNIGQVQIWSLEDRFICIAPSNARLPANATEQNLRGAIVGKNQHRKLLRDFHQHRPRLAEDLPERMIRAAADARRQEAAEAPGGDGGSGPASIVPIRTALDGELSKLQRAVKRGAMRIAAGAESISNEELSKAMRLGRADESNGDSGNNMDDFIELGRSLRQVNHG